MSGYSEEKFTKLFSFPYDNFLMVRREFVQIVGNDLEAKVLRIIEKTVEAERKRLSRESLNRGGGKVAEDPLDIPRDVWVPISYKMFMYELYGTVASETTLKRALKSLLDKRLIFRRYQPHARYDAPEYQLHVSVLQLLLDVLGTAGGQAVIPSILEGLQAFPAQELTPSECQKLLPSQAWRGAKSDPNYNNNNKSNNKRGDLLGETPSCTSDATHAEIAAPPLDFSSLLASVATLSQEQKQQLREALLDQPAVQPAEALPAPAPLLSAEGETGQVGAVQAAPAHAMKPVLLLAEGETGQVGEQRRDEHPAPAPKTAPAPETRSEPPKDTSLAGRVEAVFLCLDKLARQTTGDPDFSWTRSEKAKRAVKHLLADGRMVTPEKLSAVYLHMATMKPNPKTGFTWADKMSVTHVCENYDSIWLELVQAGQQPCLNDTTRGKPPSRTLVVYGSTEQEPPSQPLPVVVLQRDTPRRWHVGKGI